MSTRTRRQVDTSSLQDLGTCCVFPLMFSPDPSILIPRIARYVDTSSSSLTFVTIHIDHTVTRHCGSLWPCSLSFEILECLPEYSKSNIPSSWKTIPSDNNILSQASIRSSPLRLHTHHATNRPHRYLGHYSHHEYSTTCFFCSDPRVTPHEIRRRVLPSPTCLAESCFPDGSYHVNLLGSRWEEPRKRCSRVIVIHST